MYIFYISYHRLGTCLTILKDYRKGRCIIRLLCEDFFAYLWWQISRKLCTDLFLAHQFSLVFEYLMCGLKQLFFFQCGPEMPEGWTPLAERVKSLLWNTSLLKSCLRLLSLIRALRPGPLSLASCCSCGDCKQVCTSFDPFYAESTTPFTCPGLLVLWSGTPVALEVGGS